MAKKQTISRYTAEELRSGVVNGNVWDWTRGFAGLPQPKAVLNMRVDRDILEFFKTGGRGYQTKINAVLRAYKEAHSQK